MNTYTSRLKKRTPAQNDGSWWDEYYQNNLLDDVTLNTLLSANRVLAGGEITAGTGLEVEMSGLSGKIGGETHDLVAATLPLTAAVPGGYLQNWIFVTADGTLTVDLDPPTGDCLVLAMVDTSETEVLRIADLRAMMTDGGSVVAETSDNLLLNTEFSVNQTGYNGEPLTSDYPWGQEMWVGIPLDPQDGTDPYAAWNVLADGTVAITHGSMWQRNNDMEYYSGTLVTFSISEGSVTISGAGLANPQVVTPSTPHTWTLDMSANAGLQVGETGESFRAPKLEPGIVATTYIQPDPTLETLKCNAYFLHLDAPVVAVGLGDLHVNMATGQVSCDGARFTVATPVEMVGTPEIVAYYDMSPLITTSIEPANTFTARQGQALSETVNMAAIFVEKVGKACLALKYNNAASALAWNETTVLTSNGIGIYFDARPRP